MGPHQITELTDLLLGIELRPQVKEVQKCPQGEAHHEVLAVVEGQDAAGVLLGEASRQKVAVASCRSPAEL